MTTPLDVTDEEAAQLRVLYSVHLNSTASATYRNNVIRSLVAKHLAEYSSDPAVPLVNITARGIEIVRAIGA